MKEKPGIKTYTGLFTMVFLFWFLFFPGGTSIAETKTTKTDIIAEEILEGFEEGFEDDDPFSTIDVDLSGQKSVLSDDTPFRIGGFVKLEAEYGFNKKDENLSKLQPVLFIESQYKLNENYRVKLSGQAFYDAAYDIEAKDRQSNLDDESCDVELKDFYLEGKLGTVFSIRLGRQVIAWGDSDYAKITDVVNPRDLTQPGLIDLEDARIPVTSFRVSGIFDTWVFDAVTIHEHPGSKISGKGSDFDYFIRLRNSGVSINEKQTPDFGLEETGVALKVTHAFNGGDVSFVAANVYDDQPYLSYKGLNNGIMQFSPEYDRVSTYGISSSLAKGSGLFKLETAFRQDKIIMTNDFSTQISSGLSPSSVRTTSTENQVLALAGAEYTGFTDLRLSFEAQVTHTIDHKSNMVVDENEVVTYFQATKDLFNQTLELDLFWVHLNPGNGNILRLSFTYDLLDAVSFQAGIVFYESDKKTSDLHSYKDQDKVFVRVKYSF